MNTITKQYFLKLSIVICVCIFLSSCTQTNRQSPWENNTYSNSTVTTQSQAPYSSEEKSEIPLKIGFMAPLTGNSSTLGQELLNAAQLALFDLNATSIELIPRDTMATPAGASQAAQELVKEGVSIILGPLFADNFRAASSIATSANIPIIGFTTDVSVAGQGRYVAGFLPSSQTEHILGYAYKKGHRDFVIVVPNNAYGDLVESTAKRTLRSLNAPIPKTIKSSDISNITKELVPLLRSTNRPPKLLLAFDINQSSSIVRSIMNEGIEKPVVLGLGLWDNYGLSGMTELSGSIFAAPTPSLINGFITNYQDSFKQTPPRIASLSYDLTALIISLARKGTLPTYAALSNPAGFSGIDGIFRFNSNGVIERELAILEIQYNGALVLQEAAQTFPIN